MFTHKEAQILGLFCVDNSKSNSGCSCMDDCERCAKVTMLCCDDPDKLASGKPPFFVRWFTGDFRGIPLVLRVFLFALLVAAIPIMIVFMVGFFSDQSSSSMPVTSALSYTKGLCDIAKDEIKQDRIAYHSRSSSRSVHKPPLLTYLFIAGIEGSGHHAFLNLLTSSSTSTSSSKLSGGVGTGNKNYSTPILNISDTHDFNAASRDFWVNTDPRKYESLREHMFTTLNSLSNKVMSGGKPKFIVGPVTVTNEPLSFPFGPSRDAVSRPVMRDVRQACMFAKVRLITLVLYRDPFSAVFSRVHSQSQELNYHELLQAKIVEDNLQNLAMEVMSMRCGTVYTVHYEQLLSNPAEISKQIALFSGIDLKYLHQAKIAQPQTKMTLSETAQKGLKAHLGYKEGEAALRQESIRARGWYPIVAPELDIKSVFNRKLLNSAAENGFCCRSR